MNFEGCKEIFDRAREDRAFSGGCLAIGRGDRIFLSYSCGKISYKPDALDVTEHTLFDLASLSKIFGTTMVALRFMDQGRISPDDLVSRYFPEAPRDTGNITLRQLMTHTSGIAPGIPLYRVCGSREEAASAILNHPLEYRTGEETRYSCSGFILLGKILEKAGRKGLDRLAEELVFRPLGLNRTGYRPIDQCKPDDTAAFTETDTLWGPGRPGWVHDENARFLGGVSGNAGVFSDLCNCVSFASALAENRGGISRELFREALMNYTVGMDDNRGLGFQLGGPVPTFMGEKWGSRCYGHTGFTGTSLMVDRETGFFTVMLTNRVHPARGNGKWIPMRREIHDLAYDIFTGN